MSPKLIQIRELLSRNLDAVEIAHRLHVTVDYVTSAIKILKQKKLDCR
jgi:DNA-binding MarR family transcriptional regulator